MKTFRLAGSEFKKIFTRPATVVLVVLCMLVLIICSLSYSPESTAIKTSITGENIISLNSKFNSSSEIDGKTKLDQLIEDAEKLIENTTNSNGIYDSLKNDIDSFQTYFSNDFHGAILHAATNPTYRPENEFKELKSKADKLHSKLQNLNNGIDFFITISSQFKLEDYFFSLSINIPNNMSTYDNKQFIDKGNEIVETYLIPYNAKVKNVFATAKKFELNEKDKGNLEKFAVTAKEKLSKLSTEITNFFNANYEKRDQATYNNFKLLLTRYKSTAILASEYLKNQFRINICGGKSDGELNTYVGFNSINIYELKQICTKNNYIVTSDKYEDEFMTTFAFNSTSTPGKNAYDFTFFVMTIISIIITVYCIYSAATTFAGEESSGTLKMTLIKPYKRSKIFYGKFLSIIMSALIMLIGFGLLSFILGAIIYGVPSISMLCIFNGTVASVASPFMVLILAMILGLISVIFFVSIALLISVIFKSGIFATLISFIFLLLNIVLNAFCSTGAWMKFLPFAHVNLFKFFGGASMSGSFFQFTLYSGASFILSSIYLILFIILCHVITISVFKRREY